MRKDEIDTWMFLTVAYAQRGDGQSTLAGLISTADAINHAIPTDEELHTGLNRLIAAGLAAQDESQFRLTKAGESLFAEARKRGGLWKQWERLERAFATLEDPSTQSWMPAPGEIHMAIRAYQEQAAEMIDAITRDG
jgi:hypothetical protein